MQHNILKIKHVFFLMIMLNNFLSKLSMPHLGTQKPSLNNIPVLTTNLNIPKNTKSSENVPKKNPELPSHNLDTKPISVSSGISKSSVEDEKALKNKKIIELDKLYILPNEDGMEYDLSQVLKEGYIYLLEVKGMGMINLEILDAQSRQMIMAGNVYVSSMNKFNYIPMDGISIEGDKKKILKISKHGMMASNFTIRFNSLTHINMDFNSSYKIITSFCSNLNIIVKNPDKHLKKNMMNRLQFLLQTTKQPRNGEEILDMYINKSNEFPSQEKFEMQASGSLGNGLVKTVSDKNPYYCIEEGCEYYVTLNVLGIREISFFPTIFANGETISFHNNMFLIEELEPNEVVSYVLEVPEVEGNWVFTITPSENSPKFYINPDKMPAKLDDYLYKGTAIGPQEIIITNMESKVFGFSYKKFYVTYTSSIPGQTTTFRFEAHRFNPNQRKYLKPNYYESGLAAQDEVINYFLQAKSDEPESHSIIVQLNSVSGKADLYVKECLQSEKNCQINEQDIKNSYQQDFKSLYKNRIFRVSQAVKNGNNPTTDEILLNFNCIGKAGAFNDEVIKSYPNSDTCTFAIGVYNKQSDYNTGVPYGLITKGLDILKNLPIRTTTNVVLTKNEKIYYEIPLQSPDDFRFLKIKVVTLTGSARIFCSKFNKTPNANDFEAKIEINKRDYVSLHAKAYTQFLFLGNFQGDRVYCSFLGDEYSVLDVYMDLTMDDTETKKVEYLVNQKILHRQLDRDSAFDTPLNEVIYHEDFTFKFDKLSEKYEYIQIKIDGHAFGLEICVQKGKKKVDQNQNCDYSSKSEQLRIDFDNQLFKEDTFLAITVRIKAKSEGFLNFPINFTILLENDDKLAKITLHKPGFVHTREVGSNGTFIYQLDVSKMTFRSLILFTTESSNLDCEIYYNRKFKHKVSHLGHENFAFEFKNGNNFKRKHCKAKSCFIYAIVSNKGDKKENFSITYTIDSIPFVLKEGEELFVPAPIPNYYIFSNTNTLPINFNFASEVTSLVAYGMISSKNTSAIREPFRYLTEKQFDYKTSIDRNAQIIVDPKELKSFKDPVCIFHTIPKFDFNDVKNEVQSIEYDKTALLRVMAHSGIQKLIPYHQTESQINKGDFKHFSITLKPPKKFSLFLSLNSGDADLYLNPGHFNLTTTKHYWKKSSVGEGDELVIDESMFLRTMPETFTVGVRANEFSDFSLIFSPDSRNIIRLKYQILSDVQLKKDQIYYFDFLNKKNKFNSILYASNSDVEVSVLEYGKTKNDNFYNVIKDESNYLQKFTFKKGEIPRKKFSEAVLDINSHYVIRMKAIDADTDVNFLIYDKTQPILTNGEKRFHFALDKDDTQVFVIRLDSEYKEVDVDLKMSFGNLEFSVNDRPESFDDFTKVTKTSQKFKKYYMDKKNIHKSNDIVLFSEIYIKVKAWEFSKFSISVKPNDKFKNLKENESEIVYTNSEKDVYLYYEISKKKLKNIKSLNIDIYTEQYYTGKPELLFIPEKDVTLNKNSAFIPMDIEDYFENSIGEQRHLIIKPKVTVGNFIIKIAKQKQRIPLKFLISLNDVRHIEVNGYYKGKIINKKEQEDEYSMFLPSAGEFRILPDTCSGVDISKAVFYEKNKEEKIEFTDRYNQGYDYITIDESGEKVKRVLRLMELPIRRGIVNGDGVLKFKIKTHDYHISMINKKYLPDPSYFLITEFRPDNKELIMKDYVNLWGSEGAFSTINFDHVYKNGRLQVDAQFPRFREQLLNDYPGIKKIFVKFDFYLLNNPKFHTDLGRCGFGALKMTKNIEHSLERIISREEINKVQKNITFYFTKDDLRTFKESPKVDIFSKLSIKFIENEEDEYNISLNRKFTEIPYFVLTIPNDEYSKINWLLYLLIISLVLGFLYMIKSRKDSENIIPRNNYEYQKGEEAKGTKIEMS